MSRRFAGVAVAGALALSACVTAQPDEGRALAAAQDAVAAAAQGVHQAYVAGVISKVQVQKAAQLVDLADAASIAARKAYASGDASSAAGALAQLTALTAEIIALEKPQ